MIDARYLAIFPSLVASLEGKYMFLYLLIFCVYVYARACVIFVFVLLISSGKYQDEAAVTTNIFK